MHLGIGAICCTQGIQVRGIQLIRRIGPVRVSFGADQSAASSDLVDQSIKAVLAYQTLQRPPSDAVVRGREIEVRGYVFGRLQARQPAF